MGPREVEQLTLWEIAASVDAFNRLNGAEPVEPPSDDEFDDMVARKMLIANAKS